MINYREIWESINDESSTSSSKPQIARRITSKGIIYTVFLATDFRKGIRLLYIKLDPDQKIITDNLPRFRGLEISISQTSIGEFVNQEFIRFTQSIPNTENIFESVISDICDKVVQLQSKSNLNSVLIKVLNEWKVFFEKLESNILSVNEQKGLLGELFFLKDYLFQKYSYVDSLYYWTGAEKTNHDFQINDIAVEVKTTSSKQHLKFSVSSEKQLDNKGVSNLYLSLYAFNLHSNIPSRSLPAFVREICNIIHDDPIATFLFEIRLLKYGFNDKLSDHYKIGFSLTGVKFFEVKEGFPRILQNNLPEGIGDLKYTVSVAACSPYLIKTDLLKLL